LSLFFINNKFFSELKRKHGLGLLSRKPFLKILIDYGYKFEELDRDRAKAVLDELSMKATTKIGDYIKAISLALFTPTTLLYALAKKVFYNSGAKSREDFIILHLTIEIPRAFRTTLFYHAFITIPLNEEGYNGTVSLHRKLWNETTIEPLTTEDCEHLKTIGEQMLMYLIYKVYWKIYDNNAYLKTYL
jgi:hypothetical protein